MLMNDRHHSRSLLDLARLTGPNQKPICGRAAGTMSQLFKSEGEVRYPVLTDMDNGYALSLNLAIWVGDEMQKILESGGRQLPDYQGNNAWVLPISATFVIARDGTITARFIDPDFRKRVAIKDLLKALQDAQSQEEAGRKA